MPIVRVAAGAPLTFGGAERNGVLALLNARMSLKPRAGEAGGAVGG